MVSLFNFTLQMKSTRLIRVLRSRSPKALCRRTSSAGYSACRQFSPSGVDPATRSCIPAICIHLEVLCTYGQVYCLVRAHGSPPAHVLAPTNALFPPSYDNTKRAREAFADSTPRDRPYDPGESATTTGLHSLENRSLYFYLGYPGTGGLGGHEVWLRRSIAGYIIHLGQYGR